MAHKGTRSGARKGSHKGARKGSHKSCSGCTRGCSTVKLPPRRRDGRFKAR